MIRYLLIVYLLVCMGMFMGSSVVNASAGIMFPVVKEDGLWSRDDMIILFDVYPSSSVMFDMMNKTDKIITFDYTKMSIEKDGEVYKVDDYLPRNFGKKELVVKPKEMIGGMMRPISEAKVNCKVGDIVIFNLPYLVGDEERVIAVKLMRID